MMETIMSWITEVIGQALDAIVTIFLNNLQLDLSLFINTFPIVVVSYKIFQAIGVGLVLGIALFQLMKFFAGQLSEIRDTPIRILIRSTIATALIWFGGFFVSMVVDLARTPYDIFMNDLGSADLSFSLSTVEAGTLFATDIAAFTLSAGTLIVLSLILIVLIGFNVLKLMLEVCERFLMVGVLSYSAPLIYPTLASQSTSAIFKKWLGMFFGQCMLMTLSVWSLKIVLSGFSFPVDAESGIFIRLVLTLAMCKIAQRMDMYMQQLGIGVASTGGNLLDDVVGMAMAFRGSGSKNKSSDAVLGSGGGNGGGLLQPGGLFGGAANVFKQGVSSFKAGASQDEIKAGVAQSFKDGMKGPFVRAGENIINQRKAAQEQKNAESAKAGVEAFERRSAKYVERNGTAGGYTKDIQDKANAVGRTSQQYAQAMYEADGAGSVVANDVSKPQLDEQAIESGLVWTAGTDKTGKPNQIKGTSDAVGEHMAANFEKANNIPSYQSAMVETAQNGSQLAAEQAMMDPRYELENNDQLGAALMSNAFAQGIDQAYGNEKDSSGNYTEMTELSSALKRTSEGESAGGGEGVRNIKATTDPNSKGRVVTADYEALSGAQYKLQFMDDTAYRNESEGVRREMKVMKSQSGETYYTRSSEVTIDKGTPAIAVSTPNASQPVDMNIPRTFTGEQHETSDINISPNGASKFDASDISINTPNTKFSREEGSPARTIDSHDTQEIKQERTQVKSTPFSTGYSTHSDVKPDVEGPDTGRKDSYNKPPIRGREGRLDRRDKDKRKDLEKNNGRK